MAPGQPHDLRSPEVGPGQLSAHAASQLTFGGVEVGAEHTTALRLEKPDGELSDEAQPDYQDGIAQSQSGQAHSLHGDGAEHREGRVFEGDSRRHGRTEVLRDADDPGMRPVRGDMVARLELLHTGATRQDDACRRVAEPDRLIQFREHLPDRGEESFVRLSSAERGGQGRGALSLAQQRPAGEVDDHFLRARRDDRADVGDQHVGRPDQRFGHGGHPQFPVAARSAPPGTTAISFAGSGAGRAVARRRPAVQQRLDP